MIKINLLNGPGVQYPDKTKKLEETLIGLDVKSEKAAETKASFEEEKFSEVEKKLKKLAEEEIKTPTPGIHTAKKKWKRNVILAFCVLIIIAGGAIFLFKDKISLLTGREAISPPSSVKKEQRKYKTETTETGQQKPGEFAVTTPEMTLSGMPVEEIYLPELRSGTNLLEGTADLILGLSRMIEVNYVKINLAKGSLSGIFYSTTPEEELRKYITGWDSFSSMDVFFTGEEDGQKKVVAIFDVNFPPEGGENYKYYDLAKIAKVIGYSAHKCQIPVPLLKVTGRDSQNRLKAHMLGICDIQKFPAFIEALKSFNINVAYNSILLMKNREGKYEFSIELKILEERRDA